MKYKVIKRKLTMSGAMSSLFEGYFIRRSGWKNGTVLFTKEDYQEIEWESGTFESHLSLEELRTTHLPLLPQFWYILGDPNTRYQCSPNDVVAKDWEVVLAEEMTESEQRRIKGKIGGVLGKG